MAHREVGGRRSRRLRKKQVRPRPTASCRRGPARCGESAGCGNPPAGCNARRRQQHRRRRSPGLGHAAKRRPGQAKRFREVAWRFPSIASRTAPSFKRIPPVQLSASGVLTPTGARHVAPHFESTVIVQRNCSDSGGSQTADARVELLQADWPRSCERLGNEILRRRSVFPRTFHQPTTLIILGILCAASYSRRSSVRWSAEELDERLLRHDRGGGRRGGAGVRRRDYARSAHRHLSSGGGQNCSVRQQRRVKKTRPPPVP